MELVPMAEKWGVRDGTEEWEVSVQDGRIILMHCAGPFGLPVSSVSLNPQSAESVAKSIMKARNSVKRSRAVSAGEKP
jgi:hypothetical protein